MSRSAANLQNTVVNLAVSSLNSEIRNNDTLGVWTYNDTLYTGELPLTRWSDESRKATAMVLAKFIQDQTFEKRARFAKAIEGLSALVKSSDHLTVLIFTDGSETITGTPFDKEINAAIKPLEDTQRKAKMPFVIVLRSEKGKFIGHSVNAPPFAIEFPPFTPEPEPPTVIPASPPPPQAVVVVPSLIISNPPPPSPTNAPETTTRELAHAPTNTQPAIDPYDISETKDGARTIPSPTAHKTAQAQQQSQTDEPAQTSNPSSTAPAARKMDITLLIMGAMGLVILGAAVLIFILLRQNRSRSHVSLITRSMDEDKNP